MTLLVRISIFTAQFALVAAQCYYGAGEQFRGPPDLVPCSNSGESSCCLLGDVCLSGNACWNDQTGDTYQYGCTDINYADASCPFKCGWNATKSPWTALEYCDDLPGKNNVWTCQSPESCGCEWGPSVYELLVLSPRGCAAMGSEARAALYAPAVLAPFLSLPTSQGGSTGYFSTYYTDGSLTWVTTAISGCKLQHNPRRPCCQQPCGRNRMLTSIPTDTPTSIGPFTTYSPTPTKIIQLDADQSPAPATQPNPILPGKTATTPTAPVKSESFSSPASTSHPSTSSSSSTTSTTTGSSGSSKTTSSGVNKSMSSVMANSHTGSSNSSSGGLSSDAKIGIGVGVGVGGSLLLAVLAASFFMLGRKRRAKRDSVSDGLRQEKASTEKGPLTNDGEWGFDPNAHYVGMPAVIHEAPSPQPEMSALPKTPPAELDAGEPLYELDSTSHAASRTSMAPAYNETGENTTTSSTTKTTTTTTTDSRTK